MEMVTSDSSDVNISSNVNTTTETGTRSPAGLVSSANPVILRVTILLILTVFNLSGNGFTLVTIRMTPRLWTKTNFILASMLVADVTTGVMMLWYTSFLIVVYVFNNPCSYSAAITATTSLYKASGYASIYHLILISVERYIAIVYPLHYEAKFTDRMLKWAIFTAWASGILVAITWSFWLINADLQKCVLIPVHYHLVDAVLGYIPVCITMFICYGRILVISWRQRRRIEPINVHSAPGSSTQGTAVTILPLTQTSKTDNSEDPKHNPQADTGSSTEPAVTSGMSSAELAEQQGQKIKSRRRQFKAVYLTAAIVGVFVILWFPNVLGRILASVGYNPVDVNYVFLVGGSFGAVNFSFTWIIYAVVSKSYRRAYRQMLIRIGCCCCKNITLQADIV